MGIDIRALAITVLLAVALYYTQGIFVLPFVAVLPVIFALVLFGLPRPDGFVRRGPDIALAVLIGFLTLAGFSLLPDVDWLRTIIDDVREFTYLPYMRGLFALAGVLIVALRFFPSRWIFFAVLAAMLGSYALIMPTSPSPGIDVWTVHEEGAQAFVDGENPYQHTYTNIYPEELRPTLTPGGVTFSYMPGVFIWMAPWKALGLDTRYSQLATRLLTCLLLWALMRYAGTRTGFMQYVPSLLFLCFPSTTFFIVRSWNDDIAIALYALAAWGMVTRRPWALFLACNCLLLHKQHAIFFVPVLIWFAWRAFRQPWWNVIFKSTFAAVAICGAYLIVDWRNFLGSLYGLTFLKFPNIHTVFLERRDPFSLMNYLHLYTGLRSSFFFVLVVLWIGWIVWRANARQPSAPSVLRGIGAMALGLFIWAPIAFGNYYEFAWGLILIGWASTPVALAARANEKTNWEFRGSWWFIGYVTTRSVILFLFSDLIIESRWFSSAAQEIVAGKWPYFDFSYLHSPFSLVPALLPWGLRSVGDFHEFIAYHTLFQLTILACDAFIARRIFLRWNAGRVSRFAMTMFVFGPLLVAPLYFTSAVLASVAAAWAAIAIIEKFAKRRTKGLTPVPRGGERFVEPRNELYIAIACGLTAAVATALMAAAGFDLELDPLLTPTHAIIWILALAPLCPPMRTKVAINAYALSITGALIISIYLFSQVEAVHADPDSFSTALLARNVLAALAVVCIAIAARGRRGSYE